MKFHGISDIGLARTKNQDVWLAEPELGFFALADGIGGRRAGEVAAHQTILSLCVSIRTLSLSTNKFQDKIDISTEIRRAIEEANRSVFAMSCDQKRLQGMGSTLCCLLSVQNNAYFAHVGDSRIYRFREHQLDLLTHDHSLFARWLAQNRKDLPCPPKNIITRAIGMAKGVNPEISFSPIMPEDLYILCSDGLTDAVEHDELEEIMNLDQPLEEMAKKMIISAKNRGSGDNITVLIVRL